MIIIYLVELTTTDTLNIHTLTNSPPKTETNHTKPNTNRVQVCTNVCTVYTIIKGKCDNISVRGRKYFMYINFYGKQFETE